ncbi:ABC transporter multidrug-family permease [Clostridioides difficile]|uniref:ABC transporter permease n=1 Tax=Clostridioides difficile TaxID=1496 RepID=UPI000D1D8571|nr:ABC transporter permease [Clostridioides difficile]EGT2202569.1 ABC transporter permease [Clostridioides difficile]EGT4665895.1 ABC transporter permease [Clostridioides difficile]UUC40318.1 ABC transporter permease [Clostridioides difficile]UWD42900.1 ABC transporter permease [Clostridioides difficile]UWD46489.1 ABC transporter permease [Clostridioides difficile]
MLAKLLKYELKASGRVFIPLYIAILIVAVFNGIFMNTNILQIQGIAILVLTSLFMALAVLTIVVTIQRFRKNLLGDEGYLMFTLPVSTSSLILSKCITALIYAVVSFIVAIFTFGVLMLFGTSGILLPEILDLFNTSFKWISENFLDILVLLLVMLTSYSLFILLLYTSISMGQLPKFNKHRNIVAFASFIAINIVISIVGDAVGSILPKENTNMIYHFYQSSHFMFAILGDIVVIVALFFATKFILDKKLNLE